MDKALLEILDYINEGTIIVDREYKVKFVNRKMEKILEKDKKNLIEKNIFNIVPNLNKNYISKAMELTFLNDYQYFFSAAMHRGLINENMNINLRFVKIENQEYEYLMIECIDVTNQTLRIEELKNYNLELKNLNKKLREKEREIEKLAYYDKLTQIGNRNLFFEMALKYLENSKRKGEKFAIIFIDINKFKEINDSYGHIVGDKVLIEVASRLKNNVREYDLVSRHGGDEFLVLLSNLEEYDNYKKILNRMYDKDQTISVKIDENLALKVNLSIGASFYPKDGDTISKLIEKADFEMYDVKKR